MTRYVMLAPVGKSDGIFPASLGLVKALQDAGISAKLFKPFSECCCQGNCSTAVSVCQAVKYLADDMKSELVEKVLANLKAATADNPQVVVIEGVATDSFNQDEINAAICHAVDGQIMLVNLGTCKVAKALNAITLKAFGNAGTNRFLGNIVLNDDAPLDASGTKKLVLAPKAKACCGKDGCGCQKESFLDNIIANIPYCPCNYAPRASDIAAYLEGETAGDASRRMACLCLDSDKAQEEDVLVTDKLVPTKAGTVILTGGMQGGLADKTIITTKKCLWSVVNALTSLKPVLCDDPERAAKAAECGAKCFDQSVIASLGQDEERIPLMSPAAFRYKLTELARAANKRIALPEGDEPRTVCAAAKVAAAKIATPVLFGNKDKILEVAKAQGVTLGEGVEFVDPDECRANYVDRLVELRKKKGLTPEQAQEMLKDNVVLATMMIERDEVDGLVSGAVHTTANTIRPPLQIIKTAPNAKLVSSVFFMLMPEQVYVFGDCAINPNPTPDELSEIAIQSADTAKTFGIDPRVAMVTYSTGTSGKGPDIDAVVEAVKITKEKRPDLNIDGPLQYDAAVMPDVAAQKAPGSAVAGKATVFIFPSLETGNTVYKAVQRSANLISIGPMLQGMKKPVNDLSRGALVDDIVYTVAITAIQATQC